MNLQYKVVHSTIIHYPFSVSLQADSYSWAAMDETAKRDADIKNLAPSVVHANKAMFIIRVHYYVHVVLSFGRLKRGLSVKLPFLLKRVTDQLPKQLQEPEQQQQVEADHHQSSDSDTATPKADTDGSDNEKDKTLTEATVETNNVKGEEEGQKTDDEICQLNGEKSS